MSVIIEFTQIEKKNIKSENKICGIYEVELEKINWKKGAYLNSRLISELFEDANNWGEVYFQPNKSKFLFYILATDLESNVGIAEIEGNTIVLAFDPIPIKEFFDDAKKYTTSGVNGTFDKLLNLLNESIENDFLICTKWG